MAEKKQLSELTTEELTNWLVVCKFFGDYFRTGKDLEFWVRLVQKLEEELARRGALK